MGRSALAAEPYTFSAAEPLFMFDCESKTQYPFVLRGCVSSILYRSPILLARRLYFFSKLLSGSRAYRDLCVALLGRLAL